MDGMVMSRTVRQGYDEHFAGICPWTTKAAGVWVYNVKVSHLCLFLESPGRLKICAAVVQACDRPTASFMQYRIRQKWMTWSFQIGKTLFFSAGKAFVWAAWLAAQQVWLTNQGKLQWSLCLGSAIRHAARVADVSRERSGFQIPDQLQCRQSF